MKVHELKTIRDLFNEVWLGYKNFEYRRNDRNFYEGDKLILNELDPYQNTNNPKYTGRCIHAIVEAIWGEGWSEIPDLPEDFVIMKIKPFKYIP